MPGMIRMLTGSADWVPQISEDSDGCLGICMDTTGHKAFNEWIGSKPPGNGSGYLEAVHISGPVVDLEPTDSGLLRICSATFSGKDTP